MEEECRDLLHTKWKQVLVGGIALTLWAGTFGTALAAGTVGQVEKPVISENVMQNSRVMGQMPELKPTWTFAVDRNEQWHAITTAQAVGNQVFALKDKKLVAIDAATGKKQWTYGQNLTSTIKVNQGVVYGVSQAGQVYAVSANQGKSKWTAKYAEVVNVIPQGDRVYVLHHERKIDALSAATGKLLWSTEEPEANYALDVMEADGVLLSTFSVQGALTSVQLNAFDLKTGKKKWGQSRQDMPILVKNGMAFSRTDEWNMDDAVPDRKLTILGLDLQTGKARETREYSYKLAGQPPYSSGGGRILLDGNNLYMEQGQRIAQYDFSSEAGASKPVKTWAVMTQNVSFIGAMHQGKFLFQDRNTQEIKGIKMSDSQEMAWTGDNPAAQVEIYGSVMYRAQTDGILYGLDVDTTKALFKVRTNAHYYGPTLKTGRTVIIQAEDRLIGVRLPASVK